MDRRTFLKMQAITCLSLGAGGLILSPELWAQANLPDSLGPLMKRKLGCINFNVTTLGLGGQASLQRTPQDVDPVAIIIKAYELGINYFDTSNVYDDSQVHYGAAFKKLGLVPNMPNYSEEKRKNVFLTSKTLLRWANKNASEVGVRSVSDGPAGSGCIDDLKRTLSQVFGDGQGNYPKGAYIDMVLTHSINTKEDVDALYEGLTTKEASGRVGTLAALRDFRDGTNHTGFNPEHEKLIRHIGLSGHGSPAVLMDMIQRDEENLLEGLLVSINPNDNLYFNMQNNVIPVAKAKGMGIIGMKAFSNGAMYNRVATWSYAPEDNIRTIGDAILPSYLPIQYALTTPGVDTVIVGIGQISEKKAECQLYQNLLAAQITPQGLNLAQRKDIESITSHIKDGKTNYFQSASIPLSPPREVALEPLTTQQGKKMRITWQTAYAADAPIKCYQVWRDNVKIGEVTHKPQTTVNPFVFEDVLQDIAKHEYKLITVDEKNRNAMTSSFVV